MKLILLLHLMALSAGAAVLSIDLPNHFDHTLSKLETTSLYLYSEGEYIGLGDEHYFAKSNNADIQRIGWTNFIIALNASPWTSSSLSFDAPRPSPGPEPLLVGQVYETSRFGSASTAVLSITLGGRGHNQSQGIMEVIEIEYNARQEITSADIIFEYRGVLGNGATEPLFGRFRFHATPVPEPTGIIFLSLGGLLFLSRKCRHK